KISSLKKKIDTIENAPEVRDMPESVQDVIKEKFSFSQDENEAALEGAVALAKFGQFERALTELNELINIDSVRLDSAKNIIRCHMALDSVEEVVTLYEEWYESDLFTPQQLNKLRFFLQSILDKKGIDQTLSQLKETVEETPAEPEIDMSVIDAQEMDSSSGFMEEELLDISSVGITLNDGPRKGQTIELDVSFQSGNVINLLISSRDKEFIDNLKTGLLLKDIQFYSPIAMFNGKGVISAKSQIENGPKKGDFSLDIEIKSIQ
ncbi:hypothetical protein QUF76_17050, partial [Desulfobacterales bacterium HSG16]|nr:hypothetical protein [Desulfobacterales bacterium HSG16]